MTQQSERDLLIENARLRGALEKIRDPHPLWTVADVRNIAAATLTEKSPRDNATEADRLGEAIVELHAAIWDDRSGWPEHMGDVARWCREAVGDEAIDAAAKSREQEA